MKQRRGEILCLYNARSWVKLKEEGYCVWKKDGYLISAACYCLRFLICMVTEVRMLFVIVLCEI